MPSGKSCNSDVEPARVVLHLKRTKHPETPANSQSLTALSNIIQHRMAVGHCSLGKRRHQGSSGRRGGGSASVTWGLVHHTVPMAELMARLPSGGACGTAPTCLACLKPDDKWRWGKLSPTGPRRVPPDQASVRPPEPLLDSAWPWASISSCWSLVLARTV